MGDFFKDWKGQQSSGRLMAAYCVVAALACWLAGVWLPHLAAHAKDGMQAFLTAAGGFYGFGKFPETAAAKAGALSPILTPPQEAP